MQPIRSDRDRLTAALSTVGGSDEVMVIPGPFLPELLAQFVVPANGGGGEKREDGQLNWWRPRSQQAGHSSVPKQIAFGFPNYFCN
jgi:hypothetical protein